MNHRSATTCIFAINMADRCAALLLTIVRAGAIATRAADIDPQTATSSPDGKSLWYNCKHLHLEGKGWTETSTLYSRLPAKCDSPGLSDTGRGTGALA